MITTLCYTNLKQPEPPELEQDNPDSATELPVPKAKADGSAPSVPQPEAPRDEPPLPPPSEPPSTSSLPVPDVIPERRLTGKTGLRATQGGVVHPLQTVQGFNEVQGSGECLGVLDVEGQGSGESMNHAGLQDMGVQFFAETLSRLSNVEAPRAKNDRSEELSCALLGIEGPLDRDRVLEAVRAIKEPKGSQVRLVQRQAQGTMVIFGAYTHGGCHGITRPTYRRPQLVRLLNRYVSQVAPRAEYSALAVSTGVQLDWHRDCHNLLDSINWVIPLGRFQGGEIRVLLEGQSQDEADLHEHSGFRLDVAQGPVSFNARRRHCVLPFTGDRVVLVGYTLG